ncbi:MAG: enoyl-CoA hydratase/isomerase family protein, partial [Acidimicrobiales bacterium]
ASGAVAAQGLAKRAIDEGLSSGLSEGLELERRLFGEVFRTNDAQSGVSVFLEEGPGKARFSGN